LLVQKKYKEKDTRLPAAVRRETSGSLLQQAKNSKLVPPVPVGTQTVEFSNACCNSSLFLGFPKGEIIFY
jgi:hypothetical protein